MVSKNINENFVNSERVQKTFKDFIHALVWESLYIDEGVEENEVNEHIEEYCNAYINSRIKEESDNIINFLKNKEDDFEHEMYRQKISCICSGEEATEDAPIDCTKATEMLIIGEEEAQGLSTLEMPRISNIFQDYEGIVWVNIEGCDEPMEADMLPTSDLKNIIEWLEKNYGPVVATDYCWVYYKKNNNS